MGMAAGMPWFQAAPVNKYYSFWMDIKDNLNNLSREE